jgi:RNA polymerase sigma factor (sigma-70 family)
MEQDLTAQGAQSRKLAALYEQHVGRAVSLATLLTGDPSVAEDISHEAFVRVAGRFAYLRKEALFETYLRRTVVNLVRARFRRLRIERAYLRCLRPDSEVREDNRTEDREVVWASILRLPIRQREALVLRYYEDLSEAQAGEILRCSPHAVNALVSRALATLRADLQEES